MKALSVSDVEFCSYSLENFDKIQDRGWMTSLRITLLFSSDEFGSFVKCGLILFELNNLIVILFYKLKLYLFPIESLLLVLEEQYHLTLVYLITCFPNRSNVSMKIFDPPFFSVSFLVCGTSCASD